MKIILVSLLLIFSLQGKSQIGFTYQTSNHKLPLAKTIDFATQIADYDPKLVLIERAAPEPLNETKLKKRDLDSKRVDWLNTHQKTKLYYQKTTAPSPSLLTNFNGNVTQGTPNDNDVAISNGGRIVSVVNQNLYIYNDSGKFLLSRSLATFANVLGQLNRTFDPRVIYDPISDKFILVFLQGSTSADTRIIVAFSKTNLPEGAWNFYTIPGNVTGESAWSDYPIISLSESELFITVNLVKDNTPWQEGFVTSYIWQMNKQNGYAGDSLSQKLYRDIKYNNQSIWNVCPVKGGSKNQGNSMWFLSQRPSSFNNDTVFLHQITNTLTSGTAELKQTLLRTNTPYGLQPNAIQPNGKKLQTNDARILSACYENGFIHYVGNTINQANFAPSVYYGTVSNVWGTQPSISGKIISYDTMDIGYPSIAYMGGGSGDNSMLINFSHVSPTLFPGMSVVYVDRLGNISAPLMVKNGLSSIEILSDSVNRWGDYSGNQTKYNELGVCWINGSYGITGQNRTWIAKIKSNDPILSNKDQWLTESEITYYPNPTSEFVTIDFDISSAQTITFSLLDITGKLVAPLLTDKTKPGKNRFSINTGSLPSGNYFIQLTNNGNIIDTHKISVLH